MKKILLLLFLSISAIQIMKAQSKYEPLVDTTKMWSVLFDLSSEGATSYTSYIKFSTDTLIGSNVYKKVLYTIDSLHLYGYRYGYIREDTLQKKVYLMNNNFNEGLLYDFSINKNDTVNIFNTVNCNQPIQMIADSVDTIYFAGKIRKRIFFSDSWYGTVYAGIGSTTGVTMFGRCAIPGVFILLCYDKNDTVLYINPLYNKCDTIIPGLGVNEYDNIVTNIFPDPASDKITIQIPQPANDVMLSIYTISGQMLLQQSLQQTITEINISSLAKGIYILKLNDNNKAIVKRIVKIHLLRRWL